MTQGRSALGTGICQSIIPSIQRISTHQSGLAFAFVFCDSPAFFLRKRAQPTPSNPCSCSSATSEIGSCHKYLVNRWDKYLRARSHDSEAEIAAEESAKEELQHGSHAAHHSSTQGTPEQELEDDFESRQLLPLWLRTADRAGGAAVSDGSDSAGSSSSEEIIAELQRLAFPPEQAADVDAGGGVLSDDAPLTRYNESALTPLIPTAVMWLVAEAEEKLRNDSWLNLDLAISLARLQSVAYCHFPNVQAWNCSRYTTLHIVDAAIIRYL